jgi:phage FluMu protein Com
MAIEFRCTKCNKLLRTGDDTAGKHAKCPECGEILVVPSPGTPMAGPMPGPIPSSSPGPSPFAGGGAGGFPPPSGPAGESPFGAAEQPQYQPDTGNPYQSPSPYADMPAMPVGATEIRPTIIDLGDVMGRTWKIFKEDWGMCLGVVVVAFVCNFAAGFIIGFVPRTILALTRSQEIFVASSVIGNLVAQAFSIWITIGRARIMLKIARGQPVSMGELFGGGPYFLPILGASILFGLMVAVGLVLLIVPGIVLALMFSQYYYLIIDRNLGVMDSLNTAKEISNGNKATLLMIGLACLGITIVALIPCGLGLIIASPYFALLYAVIYLAMTGQPTVDQLRAGMGIR